MLIVGGEIFNSDGPLARAGYALVVFSFVAFVVFIAYLRPVLRDAEGPGGWVATLALGAGLAYVAVRFAAQPPRMVAFYRDDLSPDLARTQVDLNDTALVSSGLLLGLFAGAAAWVCVVHRVLPRWLGFASGALAVPRRPDLDCGRQRRTHVPVAACGAPAGHPRGGGVAGPLSAPGQLP